MARDLIEIMDGGYTVSTAGQRLVDLVPDTFRLFRHYLPAARMHWKKLRFRLGRRFVDEWTTPRHWNLDSPSPFEHVRVLDPAPDRFVIESARAGIAEAFPAFREVPVAQSWAGMAKLPGRRPAYDLLPGKRLVH